MRKSARVINIDRLKDFRAALADFAADAGTACHEVDFEIERTMEWLRHDQVVHWKGEQRKWTEEVARAKSDIARKQIKSRPDDNTPSLIDEKKHLERCVQRRDEAERKLQLLKQAERYLAKQAAEARVPIRQLGGTVELQLPVALEHLARMIDALEQYVRLQAPTAGEEQVEAESGEARSRAPLFPGSTAERPARETEPPPQQNARHDAEDDALENQR